jgi:hypothetical protein
LRRELLRVKPLSHSGSERPGHIYSDIDVDRQARDEPVAYVGAPKEPAVEPRPKGIGGGLHVAVGVVFREYLECPPKVTEIIDILKLSVRYGGAEQHPDGNDEAGSKSAAHGDRNVIRGEAKRR